MKRKIISESLEEYERRLGLILASDALTDSQKKEALNRTRRDAMLQFSFYSPQMRHIDNYIKRSLKQRESHGEPVTEVVAADDKRRDCSSD